MDCNCDIDGTAFIDDCGDCVGGNTGFSPCVVGVEDVDRITDVNIYPNPTKSYINVKIISNQLPADLYIYNLLGEIVYKTTLYKTQQIINLSF
ncbi:MAG: hypothetical protein Kow0068_00430 [Marinilabiliales bacterium]